LGVKFYKLIIEDEELENLVNEDYSLVPEWIQMKIKSPTASFIANLLIRIEYNTNLVIDELLKIVQPRKEILLCIMYVCKTGRWNIIALITGVLYNPTHSVML
jgi:hypothetical protein